MVQSNAEIVKQGSMMLDNPDMKLNYYPETDSLYIDLLDAPGVESEEVRPGIFLDFDAKDQLIGIDGQNASTGKRDAVREIMKRITTFLLTFVTFCLVGCTDSETTPVIETSSGSKLLTPQQLFEAHSKSVVMIENYGSDGQIQTTGTGFFISDGGHIATNKHVTENAARLMVTIDDSNSIPAEAISLAGDGIDIAILRIDTNESYALRLNNKKPAVGEGVVVIGNPQGLSKSLSTGSVMGIREYNTGTFGTTIKLVQISAPISPGSSGSPVLNMYGEVVGIATSALPDSQNINFALESSHVSNLMGEGKEKLLKAGYTNTPNLVTHDDVNNNTTGSDSDIEISKKENTAEFDKSILNSISGFWCSDPPKALDLMKKYDIGGVARNTSYNLVDELKIWLYSVESLPYTAPTGGLSGSIFDTPPPGSKVIYNPKHDYKTTVKFAIDYEGAEVIRSINIKYVLRDSQGYKVAEGIYTHDMPLRSNKPSLTWFSTMSADASLIIGQDYHSFMMEYEITDIKYAER